MTTIRLSAFILALLCIEFSAHACLSLGDMPQNYNAYRVCDKSPWDEKVLYYNQRYKQRNLEAWAKEWYNDYSVSDIEKVVYKYSVDEMLNLYEHDSLPAWDSANEWAKRLQYSPIIK